MQPIPPSAAVVTSVHRWLAGSGTWRSAGQGATGAANLAFLLILVSGAYLWLPRSWRWAALRIKLVFQPGLPTAKARNFNWHHVFGVWALVPLLAIAFSGVVISYDWAGRLVFLAYGETPVSARQASPTRKTVGALRGPGRNFEEILTAARDAAPDYQRLALRLPDPTSATIEIVAGSGNGAQPTRQTTLLFAREDAALLVRRDGSWASPGQQARGFLRFLHTGEIYGLVGQMLAGLASLAAMFLVYTGLALAWRRLIPKRAPDRGSAPLPETPRRRSNCPSSIRSIPYAPKTMTHVHEPGLARFLWTILRAQSRTKSRSANLLLQLPKRDPTPGTPNASSAWMRRINRACDSSARLFR